MTRDARTLERATLARVAHTRMALARATLACAAVTAGCAAPEQAFVGVDAASGLEIVLRPMPQGHSFSGRFRSPHLGELTLDQRGTALTGSYRYEADGRHVVGTMHGSVRGNLATVQWREHAAEAPSGEVLGFGFFLYDAAPEDDACPPGAARPARLFGRRQVATRILPTPPDEQYSWLNLGQRAEPWTAFEIVPGERRP